MAEIEITLPTVQYGNVKVRATPEEFGMRSLADAYELGVALAVYQTTFTLGWQEGAKMDVDAPPAASQPVSEAQAQRYLDEGLGGVSEVEENGNIPMDRAAQAAPWDKAPEPAAKKPWESGNEPAKPSVILDADW